MIVPPSFLLSLTLLWALYGNVITILFIANSTSQEKSNCQLSLLSDTSSTVNFIDCGLLAANEKHLISARGSVLMIYDWERLKKNDSARYRLITFTLNIRQLGAAAFSPANENVLYLVDQKTKMLMMYDIAKGRLRTLVRNEFFAFCTRLFVDLERKRLAFISEAGTRSNLLVTNLLGTKELATSSVRSKFLSYGSTASIGNNLFFCQDSKIYRYNVDELREHGRELFRLDFECTTFALYNGEFVFSYKGQTIRYSQEGKRIGEAKQKIQIENSYIFAWESMNHVSTDSSRSCVNTNCAHFCVPLDNDEKCLCANSLLDSSLCNERPKSTLLFSSKNSIFEINLESPWPIENEIYRAESGYIDFLVYDYSVSSLFYALRSENRNSGPQEVYKCSGMNCDLQKLVGYMPTGTGIIEDTAYDQISGMLYFTDRLFKLGTIKLRTHSDSETTISKILLRADEMGTHLGTESKRGFKLRGLGVDPIAGYLFIGDYSDENLVYKSDLKARHISMLESLKVNWPNSIVVNSTNQTLYILDGDKLELHQCNYSGYVSFVKTIQGQSNSQTTNGLVKFGSNFFISYRYNSLLEMFDIGSNVVSKITDVSYTDIQLASELPISSMILITEDEKSSMTELENGCSNNNGNCSHFCFSSSGISKARAKEFIFHRECGCPDGMELSREDSTQCLRDHRMFLLTSQNSMTFFSPGVMKLKEKLNCSFAGLKLRGPAVYDHRISSVFFVANDSMDDSSLYRCDLWDPEEKVVQSTGKSLKSDDSIKTHNYGMPYQLLPNVSSESLTYDWSSRFLFWVDGASRTVLMGTIDGKYTRVAASGYDEICCLAYFVPHLYFFAKQKLIKVTVSSDWEKQLESEILLDLCGRETSPKYCNADRPFHLSVHSSGRKLIYLSVSSNGNKYASIYDLDRDHKDNVKEQLQNKVSLPSREFNNLNMLSVSGSKMYVFEPKSLHVLNVHETQFWEYPFKAGTVNYSLNLADDKLLAVTNIAKEYQPDLTRRQCFLMEASKRPQCEQFCFSEHDTQRENYGPPGYCGCNQTSNYAKVSQKKTCVPSKHIVQTLQDKTIFMYDLEDIHKPPMPVAQLTLLKVGNFSEVKKLTISSFAFDPITELYFYIVKHDVKISSLDLRDEDYTRQIFASDARGSNVRLITESSDITRLDVDPIGRLLVWHTNKKVVVFSLTHWKIIHAFQPGLSQQSLKIEDFIVVHGKNFGFCIYEMKPSETANPHSMVAIVDLHGDVRRSEVFRGQNNPMYLSIDQRLGILSWYDGFYTLYRFSFTSGLKFEPKNLLDHKLTGDKKSGLRQIVVYGNVVAAIDGSKISKLPWKDSAQTIYPAKGPDQQDLVFRAGGVIQEYYDRKTINQSLLNFCMQKNCSHFCNADARRCSCPVGQTLRSSSSAICVPLIDKVLCPANQKTLRCDELGLHSDARCPSVTFCATFDNGTCARDQQQCKVDDTKKGSVPVCYNSESSFCDDRPKWCQCLKSSVGSTLKKEDVGALFAQPVLVAVIGCLLLVVAFASVVALAIVLYKFRSNKKSNKAVRFQAGCNAYDEAEDAVNIANVSNNIEVSKSAISFNKNESNLFINTSINVHQTVNQSRTRHKSNSSDLYSVIHSTSTANRKPKKFHNHSHVPQNSIRSTSVLSSSCGTLNQTGIVPPPTPNPSLYNSDINFDTMCPDCRMRQNYPAHSPGAHSKGKKSSWGSWKRERQNSGQRYSSHKTCRGIQSGEESEPLFLPKSQGPAGLPNGSRFADFYPSPSHTTLPHNMLPGKYVKRRRFIMDELVTYTTGGGVTSSRSPNHRSGHHHHHASSPTSHSHHSVGHHPRLMPPPAPACTPLSGSQEFNSFLPPSPVSDRTSSMVYVVRQVHVGHDPPPSPVSNA